MATKDIIYLWTYPKKPKLPSKIISWRLKTNYSHVCMAVKVGKMGYYRVYQASRGWVNCVKLDNFLKYNKVIKSCSIPYDIDLWRTKMSYIDDQTGKKYSILGALAATVPFLRKLKVGDDDEKTMICSEYAYQTYIEGNLSDCAIHKSINPDYVDPHDFESIIKIDGHIIKEGLKLA